MGPERGPLPPPPPPQAGEGEQKGVGAILPRAPDPKHRDRFRPGLSYSAPTGAEHDEPQERDLMNGHMLQDACVASRKFVE